MYSNFSFGGPGLPLPTEGALTQTESMSGVVEEDNNQRCSFIALVSSRFVGRLRTMHTLSSTLSHCEVGVM